MGKKKIDPVWKIEEALASLRSRIDPYIWDQGQELYKRGAAEDVQKSADGVVNVQVLDPRDSRKFFVTVEKDDEGQVTARCSCPYRLGGLCRHQVVSLQFLKEIVETGGQTHAPSPVPPGSSQRAPHAGRASSAPIKEDALPSPAPEGSILYRLFTADDGVTTRPDGSLLRVNLLSLGSLNAPHKVGLQLFTGTGWTEVRTPDLGRWISRGRSGPHPRDAAVAACLVAEGALRREVDSETLAALLEVLAESDALVDRGGRALAVSRWPWRLGAKLTRGAGEGVGIQLECRSMDGNALPFAEVSLIPSVAPWIQLETGAFHPLIAGASGPLLVAIQEEDFSSVAGPQLDRLLSEGAAVLERLCPGAFETEPGLIEEVEGVSGARIRLEGTPAKLSGKLELCYGGEWIAAPQTPEPWTVERDGRITRYPPAGQSLARAHRELEAMGFTRAEKGWTLERAGGLAAVLAPRGRPFVKVELPGRLDALNLVDRAPVLRVRVGTGGGALGAAAGGAPAGEGGAAGEGPAAAGGALTRRRGSGIAWLDVAASLEDGGRELPIDLETLRESFRKDPQGLVQLSDGTILGLRHGPVRSLLDLCAVADILDAKAKGGARCRMPVHGIGELLEKEPGREVEFDIALRTLVEGLRGGTAPEPRELAPAAASLLRPYQKEAVRWLGQLAGWGLAGILADEMGLGKTLMALAHFFGRAGDAEGEASASASVPFPVLVVCPSSLVFNWLAECRRFFPGVRAEGLYGVAPGEREDLIRKGADLLVTSYALLRRDREVLEARDLRAVVLDEAQHIKNSDSQTAQAAFALRAPERWVLTGTPIENHLGELWSLFHFLMPGFLGSRSEFQDKLADPIARHEEEPLAKLRARVRPFLLRRTKAQVLTELPPRIDQIERVPMTEVQEQVYRAFLLAARGELEGEAPGTSRFQILAALTRLRQICCHPRLVLEPKDITARGLDPANVTSGKFELLLELLGECIEEGHRVLLYSQFTSLLDLVEERLAELEIQRCRLDGSTRDREGEVRRFARDSSIPLFLISLKAGGFGLNLTQADTVILYDPWWNPAAEEQAAARAHRMGQTLPVHVHKLITLDTVEEKILDLQATKRDLAGRVVQSEEEALSVLSAEDLKGLLFRD